MTESFSNFLKTYKIIRILDILRVDIDGYYNTSRDGKT